MWKRTIFTGVLLVGLLILLSYHQHSLKPDDLIEGQSVNCMVCLHGKVSLTHATVVVPLETRHETVELHSIHPHRSVQRFAVPSRAPPES